MIAFYGIFTRIMQNVIELFQRIRALACVSCQAKIHSFIFIMNYLKIQICTLNWRKDAI